MSQLSLQQAMDLAIRHHQQGHFSEAEAIYRQVLALAPDHPAALHLLGVIAGQVGKPDIAVDLIRRAIAISPNEADFHSNLSKFSFDLAKFEDAIVAATRATELQPNFVNAQHNLAIALHASGRFSEAEAACRRAIAIEPNRTEFYLRLALVLKDRARFPEAVELFRHVIAQQPDLFEAHNGLGGSLCALGRLDEAIAACREAIRLCPDHFDSHNNLGIAFQTQGRTLDAIASFKESIRLMPDYLPPYSNLGNALNSLWRLEEADAVFAEALARKPDFAEAHSNRGNVQLNLWRVDEAAASYRRAVALRPDLRVANSNLLMTLNYLPGLNQKDLCREARGWAERFADPLQSLAPPHTNDSTPHRRLRVGFVSADFREHPSAAFFEPLLDARDRGQMEIFCYAEVVRPDSVTKRLQGLSDHWRVTTGLSDEAMAALIRNDHIDILIDLSLHSSENRLLVFARRPAPVQATWLAYPGTTGMRAMNYRLTDPYLDPPDNPESCYAETSIWLESGFWCYGQPDNAPEVNDLPAASLGHITFGSLNNFCKVSPAALGLWADILVALPNSRLILHAHEGDHRARVLSLFAQKGIDPSRIEFVGRIDKAEYFKIYHRIDVALDPFPCAGGTTTCDALYMGVPVITLAGKTTIGRCGVSLLSSVGLPQLITHTEPEYAQAALRLAQDIPTLSKIRATLRPQMKASPLMDAPRFARAMESALRDMWHRWCKNTKAAVFNGEA